MTNENSKKLRAILKENLPQTKIVTLSELVKSVTKVSNVRVRDNRNITEYHELGIDSIDDNGVLAISDASKKDKPANESAIESQRLHKGNIIFGYRGKMGKVGLLDKEFTVPIVTNSGMMKITFTHERLEETPRYVQTYLQSNLIRTYLNSMLDAKGKLSVEILLELPIPYFEEMMGISKFSTLFGRRRAMTLEARRILDAAKELVQMREDMESETISLQTLSHQELEQINIDDHTVQQTLEQLTLQLQMIKNTKASESFLLKEFT